MQQVVIVGGGILGLACAYYLQRSGQAQVTVMDAGEFAAATTSQAAALITRSRSDLNASRFVAETHDVIRGLEHKLGEHLMHRPGCWHLINSAGKQSLLQGYQQTASELDQNTTWQDTAAIQHRFPWLAVHPQARARAYSDDGFIDPYLLASTYLSEARKAGALCISNVKVEQLIHRNNRVTGVKTSQNETLRCDAALVATGPWSQAFLRPYDIPLPMAMVRSHYWITDNQPQVSTDQPMLIIPEQGFYFRSENGALLFGLRDNQQCLADATALPRDIHSLAFAEDPKGWEALEENWEALIKVCPLLKRAQLKHYISGVSSYTPDTKPVLGRAPDWQNVYVATGCSGAGIAWSGGIGLSIAEQILQKTPTLSIEPYAMQRFGTINPFSRDFQLRCLEARSQKRTG